MLQVGQILEGVIVAFNPPAPPDANGVSYYDLQLQGASGQLEAVHMGVKKALSIGESLKVVVNNLGSATKLPYVKRWQPPKPGYNQPQGQPQFAPPQPQQAPQFAPQSNNSAQADDTSLHIARQVAIKATVELVIAGKVDFETEFFDQCNDFVEYAMTGKVLGKQTFVAAANEAGLGGQVITNAANDDIPF